MQTLCILGRQPHLGLAELESLYGATNLYPIITPSKNRSPEPVAALIDLEPADIDFSRLGGTVKFCKVLTVLDTQKWTDIQRFLEGAIPQHLTSLPEGKLKLGFSIFGLQVGVKQLNASGLALKKQIKQTGRSVRIIPNNELVLNSAQVLHNQLTGSLGWELVFVAHGKQTILAQNIAEQDIEAYAKRDQARPKRDAKVGMLPPKLAQIIVNLATGDADPKFGGVVLDPFCGTGVILQEAGLMGFDLYGSDLEPRMINFTQANLQWLETLPIAQCGPDGASATSNNAFGAHLEVGDATTHTWKPAPNFVACETYLGRPFSAQPKPEVLLEVRQNVDTILRAFLKNLAQQTKPGFRACLAVPAWSFNGGFTHLKTLDSLEKLGYTRLSFEHAETSQLIYHRPGQAVARELVVLTRR